MRTTDIDVRVYATAVARYGVRDAEPPTPVDDEGWPLTLATLAEEKVIGVATAAAGAGWLPLTDGQYEDLLDRERDAMVWCLGLECRLMQIADAFDTEGIAFLVLKGPALAHAVYADSTWRMFNDLDLLVRRSQWRAACVVLHERFGWRRRLPEPRRGFDERFGKAAVFTTETGQQIDLHLNLAQGPFGVWMEPEDFFDDPATFDLGDAVLRCPNATALFVHACIHAVLGDARPSLATLRDVVETGAGRVDHGALELLAKRWRLGSVITRSIDVAATLDAGETRRRIGRLSVAGDGSRALSAYASRRKTRGALTLETLRAIPTLRAKGRYVRDLAVPGRAFASARGSGRWRTALGWLSTGARKERVP